MKNSIRNKVICFVMAAALAVCAMTACGETKDSVSSAKETPHKFSVEDTVVKGVKLGMTTDEVKDILGKPDKEKDVTEDQFIYGTHIIMTYGQLSLSFYDINEGDKVTLGSISTEAPDVVFPGGLHVGSTKEEVLDAFAQDENAPDLMFDNTKYGSFIYGDITENDFLEKKPEGAIECAYIQDHDAEADGYYLIIYNYYNPLKWSKDGTSYTGDYYHLIFYVDTASDKVKSILLEHSQIM